MRLVIDTSVYRKNPLRDSAAFRAIQRLAKGGKLALHVPEVISKEFTTQQHQHIAAKFKEISSAAQSLYKSTKDEDVQTFTENLLTQVQELQSRSAQIAEDDFNDWLNDLGSTTNKIADDHGRRVMESYFSGQPPFKSAKNRNDIPDGFIFESLLDLSKLGGMFYFACADDTLRLAAAKISSVSCYDTLESFVQSMQFQDALKELELELPRNNLSTILAALPNQQQSLKDEIESRLETALDGAVVTSRNIPDDNNEATVISVNAPENVSLDLQKVEYYGDSEVGVPFSAAVNCMVNYAIFKSDYHCLADGKAARISIDERNDHYYDADEEYTIFVTGTLLIAFQSADLQEQTELKELISLIEVADFSVEVDAMEVEGGEEF